MQRSCGQSTPNKLWCSQICVNTCSEGMSCKCNMHRKQNNNSTVVHSLALDNTKCPVVLHLVAGWCTAHRWQADNSISTVMLLSSHICNVRLVNPRAQVCHFSYLNPSSPNVCQISDFLLYVLVHSDWLCQLVLPWLQNLPCLWKLSYISSSHTSGQVSRETSYVDY